MIKCLIQTDGRRWGRTSFFGFMVALLVMLPGCKLVEAIHYFFQPPRTQPAEVTLTKGTLVILIDMAHSNQESPIFNKALHEKMIAIFREHDVNTKVVPLDEQTRLRQANADFKTWSLSKIGRELNADQVLAIRIEELQLRESPSSPLIAPRIDVDLKVIDPNAPPGKARVWPDGLEERRLPITLPPSEAVDEQTLDAAAAALGRETARTITQYFYEVDLETPQEKEP